jgi:hypothetical protein
LAIAEEAPVTASNGFKQAITPSADVIAQRVGDGVIVVNLRTSLMYDLNRTGGRFWDLLTAGHDLAQIHTRLLQEFDVDPVELRREIETIVASLKDAGLVEERRPA